MIFAPNGSRSWLLLIHTISNQYLLHVNSFNFNFCTEFILVLLWCDEVDF